MCLKYRQFTENIDNRIIQNKLKNHLKKQDHLYFQTVANSVKKDTYFKGNPAPLNKQHGKDILHSLGVKTFSHSFHRLQILSDTVI